MSDLCPRCGNPWSYHRFEADAKDGPIAYILNHGGEPGLHGERIICRTKVKVEVVS